SWAYAGMGYLAAFAAPAAPLMSRDQGLQTMAGDFIAGASFDIPHAPELGSLDVGYVYSSGLYTNVSSERLALFATTMITDQFTLLALVRAGVAELPIVKREVRKIGSTSLYGRNMVLEAPPEPTEALPEQKGFRGLFAEKRGAVDLTTIHLEQHRIGQYVSVSGALALRPRLFLHEGSIAVEMPVSALTEEAGGLLSDAALVSGRIGIEEMPALPWYGTEGGRQLFVDLSLLGFVHVRRNAPSTLAVFPYAEGAWELSILIDAGSLSRRDDDTEAP
ncbi:MAG: hypothetical protein R3F59_38630, partial [Myxococcota bacterium]